MCSISDYEMFWITATIYNPCNAVLHRVKDLFLILDNDNF